MIYFQVNICPTEDKSFLFVTQTPEEIEEYGYMFSYGDEASEVYPEKARLYADAAHPGIKLPDLVGNTCGMLVVSKRVKEVIEKAKQEKVEYLPVALHNHKKRLESADYFIINPIGTFDCLDLEASDITWLEKEVVDIDEAVLDAKKMKKAPDVFRIQEDPRRYVFGEDLVVELQKLKPTNFFLIRLREASAQR